MYFKGRKWFLRFLENSQEFIPAQSKVNREPQKIFPAKRSSFAEPQKFILVKCLFPKQSTMNTSSQWESLEFKDGLVLMIMY